MPRPRGREWGDGWGRFSYRVLCVLREQSLVGGERARRLCKLRCLIGWSQPRSRCRGEPRGGVPPASRPAGWPLAGRAQPPAARPAPLPRRRAASAPPSPARAPQASPPPLLLPRAPLCVRGLPRGTEGLAGAGAFSALDLDSDPAPGEVGRTGVRPPHSPP